MPLLLLKKLWGDESTLSLFHIFLITNNLLEKLETARV